MTIIVKENALLCKVKFHHKLHEKAGKFHEGAGEDLYSAVVAVFTLFNTSMFMFEKTDISNNCSGAPRHCFRTTKFLLYIMQNPLIKRDTQRMEECLQGKTKGNHVKTIHNMILLNLVS